MLYILYLSKRLANNIFVKKLKKLKTDYVDLYLLHGYEPRLNLYETFFAFSKLIEPGKIRYAGVGDFETRGFKETIEFLNF